jgi:exodeoxyribonuclease V beta subunit
LPRIVRGPLADKAEWQAARRDLLEDRLRLLYVACTRAQVALWLVAGQTSGKVSPPCGPLDWILRRTDATENPVEPPEEWWENVASFGRGTRHAEGWDEILAGLPQSDPPPWRRVPLPWAELPPPWQPPDQTDAESPDAWQVLPMPTIRDPWRFTSFSALTREKHPHSDAPPEMPHTTLPAPAPLSSGAWNRFRDVPGGTLVGSAVHDWLEAWDFAVLDRNALRAHLRDYALPGGEEKWVAPVGDMLEELREVTLPGLGTDVSRACPDPRASEWHFQLPLDGPLEAEPLAAVFARHGETDYAESLAALPVGQIQGYLHGFLDRLAVWNGSWGVIDWKTNQLGPEDSAYDPPALLAAARASHYVLQTHLYLIALRRFLGPTVPLRGAWLIYLRGISPGTPRGVCPIEPSPGLLDDLDRLFLPPQK